MPRLLRSTPPGLHSFCPLTLRRAESALFAGLEGQDRERCPRVRDVMAAVAIERAREPAARLTLIDLQPGDSTLGRLLGGRNPGLAQDVQHQAGRVAVAGSVLGLRLPVLALPGA